MQTLPAAVLDATPIPGPFRTDGRRHAPRSIGEALLGAAEAWGCPMEDEMAKVYLERTAKKAFEAYNGTGPNPGLAHDGRPVPTWDEIAPDKIAQIHAKWCGAVDAVGHEVIDTIFRQLRAGHPLDAVEHNAILYFTADGGSGPVDLSLTTDRLIVVANDLITRLLQGGPRQDLRIEALTLVNEMRLQQARFSLENGPDAANPVVRAWYLLEVTLNHATLLGVPS